MAIPRQIRDLSRALVMLAQEEGILSEILKDLKTVKDAFSAHPDLAADMQEPGTPQADREAALIEALRGLAHPFVINTLLELQSMKALKHLAAFATMANNDAREIVNHYTATVWSAIPLTAPERQSLEKSLAAKLKGTIDLEEKVAPEIIGGLIVETGGWRYDASVKGICDRLKFALYAS